jgi:hypothetical protein
LIGRTFVFVLNSQKIFAFQQNSLFSRVKVCYTEIGYSDTSAAWDGGAKGAYTFDEQTFAGAG